MAIYAVSLEIFGFLLYRCNVSRLANKPRQLKSMLTHQGRFYLLIYATFTRITNYRVCNFAYINPAKKFCTSGCSDEFCLDQEWLHLMFHMVV